MNDVNPVAEIAAMALEDARLSTAVQLCTGAAAQECTKSFGGSLSP